MLMKSIICPACKCKIELSYHGYIDAKYEKYRKQEVWKADSYNKDAVFTGRCPSCTSIISGLLKGADAFTVLNCIQPPMKSLEEIEADDAYGMSRTYFRIRCDSCASIFAVGHVREIVGEYDLWSLGTVYVSPPVNIENVWESWTMYGLYQGAYENHNRSKLPIPITIRSDGKEYQMCGPCPRCLSLYRIRFLYRGKIGTTAILGKDNITKLTRTESLEHIIDSAGKCEGDPFCKACLFNNGSPENSALFYCEYWGETRAMDLARHECLGWAFRSAAAEEELKNLRLK